MKTIYGVEWDQDWKVEVRLDRDCESSEVETRYKQGGVWTEWRSTGTLVSDYIEDPPEALRDELRDCASYDDYLGADHDRVENEISRVMGDMYTLTSDTEENE